jgi:hypothetical protein
VIKSNIILEVGEGSTLKVYTRSNIKKEKKDILFVSFPKHHTTAWYLLPRDQASKKP